MRWKYHHSPSSTHSANATNGFHSARSAFNGAAAAATAEGDATGAHPILVRALTLTREASGDLREEIARLKAEDGKPIIAHGGVSFGYCLSLEAGKPVFTVVSQKRQTRVAATAGTVEASCPR